MSLSPYAHFVAISYGVVGAAIALLIGHIALDYRIQRQRLRELDRSGVMRPSGRRAADMP